MEIDRIMHANAWIRNMQYESEPDIQPEEKDGEDAVLQEEKPGTREAKVDRVDLQEGDRMLTQIRQRHGKGVYQTVENDPALAWSVKGQTYPVAVRVDKIV